MRVRRSIRPKSIFIDESVREAHGSDGGETVQGLVKVLIKRRFGDRSKTFEHAGGFDVVSLNDHVEDSDEG